MSPIVDRLALIGVGLIGGSIARAAREYGVARTIVATARSEATRKRVVDWASPIRSVDRMPRRWKDAELVIVCIPVRRSGPVAQETRHRQAGAIVPMRVGQGRGAPRTWCRISRTACISFGHPVAGTENSGPELRLAELFVNAGAS